MASSSHSTAPSGLAAALDPYRDVAGFLPLVACSKCGTKLIGRVSQKAGSKGKRFYKCPLLEHTEFACSVYMFEEDYVEYLVLKGHLPRACSRIRTSEALMRTSEALTLMGPDMLKDGHDMLKAAAEGVDRSTGLLESAIMSVTDVQAKLKAATENQAMVWNKMDRIGERQTW